MPSPLAYRIAAITSRPRSLWVRVISQTIGAVLFLIVIPPLLFWLVRLALPESWRFGAEAMLRIGIGTLGVVLGLALLGWANATFWFHGSGTAAPWAAPQRLVISGPFRYCRNPIQLGAAVYYFGLGTLFSSLSIGLGMLIVALILGTVYHKALEEKELRLRFGEEYEKYRRETPFLVPRITRRN
jgi:protein-S-isoprenylcysteine O-methyltransferase Ste14